MAPTSALWNDIWDELTPRDLPGDLEYIAEAQGMDAARQLVELCGGVLFHVPVTTGDSLMSELSGYLDDELETYLREMWGGTKLYISSRSTIMRLYREEHLEEEYDGSNELELARRYNVSVVMIQKLVRDLGEDDETSDEPERQRSLDFEAEAAGA